MKFTILATLLFPFLTFAQSYTVTPARNGYVVLKSGERKEGDLRLKIVDRKDTTEIRYKGKNKEKGKYTRDQVVEFRVDPLKIGEVKNDYNEAYRNFNPGTIYFDSGEKLEGQVAGRKKEPHESNFKNFGPVAVKYANENEEITMWWASGKRITYYIQQISGADHHYVNVYDNFVKVENPNGRFSYFRNPRPTHVNESATNLAVAVASSVEEELAKSLAAAAASNSYSELKSSGATDAEASANSLIAAMNVANEVDKAFDVENADNIYYKEYYIIDNKEQTRSIVYKKNIDAVIKTLLKGCEIDEKTINKVANVKELEEVMTFLETNVCD
ncbi:MAG: hypothetical protein ABJF04_02115 [Reichenbachiella sp.]|uniref:hypothetical protein n=2 Tax=Reichenbachiella sp. TaxID=2184521 RepID=UPI003265772F